MTTQYHTGLIFEPRALWDVQRVVSTAEEQTVLFDTREAFMNGSRYPIEITEISLAPINYLAAADLAGAGRNSGQAAFNAAEMVLAVRQRQNYSRFPIRLPGYSAMPSQEPSTRFVNLASTDLRNSSGLLGVSHKRFDRPLVLPQYGAVEIALSTYIGAAPALATTAPPTFSVAWFESGGLLEGSSRTLTRKPLRDAASPESALYGQVIPFNGEIPSLLATNATFPPEHLFTTKEFRAQSPTAQGGQRFTGVTVQIDQIDYDAIFSGGGVPPVDAPMTPLSLRTGCRVRTTDGGTKMDWWRPGAPIGLVLNTISAALTYRLPRPLTLEPGDQMEVELTVPPNTAGEGQQADTYSIGVALNGYAAIQG
jgi:hypothetical protein